MDNEHEYRKNYADSAHQNEGPPLILQERAPAIEGLIFGKTSDSSGRILLCLHGAKIYDTVQDWVHETGCAEVERA